MSEEVTRTAELADAAAADELDELVVFTMSSESAGRGRAASSCCCVASCCCCSGGGINRSAQ